jgi:ketosteroid isomerase-like protein
LVALLALLSCTFAFSQNGGPTTATESSLVATERAFARMSVARGQAEAWIEYFADEGTIFQPQPLNAKEVMRKRLPAPQPPPATLNWVPIYGDVSESGELGYDIGPWKLSDNTPQNRPNRQGYFLSVWKKQADGNWKVVADFGIGLPNPTADHSLKGSFVPAERWPMRRASSAYTTDQSTLNRMDQDLAVLSNSAGPMKDYLTYLYKDARMLRDDVAPLVGSDAMRSFLGKQKGWSGEGSFLTLKPLKADITSLGDLGYTYGTYQLNDQTGAIEHGYYLHVWKRDRWGKWLIVAGTAVPDDKNKLRFQ